MKNEQHFDKIYWFLVITVGIVLLYIFAITFLPIPKENIRFADTALSFLMGAVVGNAYSFLAGGSAANFAKKPTGTTSAEVSATITTTEKKEGNDTSATTI